MRQEDTDEIIRTSCGNMSCDNAASQTKARVDVVPLSPATRPATAVARRRRGEWGSPHRKPAEPNRNGVCVEMEIQ